MILVLYLLQLYYQFALMVAEPIIDALPATELFTVYLKNSVCYSKSFNAVTTCGAIVFLISRIRRLPSFIEYSYS